MANAFFIVGIGGCGRGVCNHIKYELEQEYGSLKDANTKILVIDGPPTENIYMLPGEFQIDTGTSSPEFYQTKVNPKDVIESIGKENGGKAKTNPIIKYVSQWLTPEAAKNIPTDSFNPISGFGGHRAPGHAFVYCDINDISKKIQSGYSDTQKLLGTGAQSSGQVIIMVIGSLSGGTGAGILFDFMHLLRHQTRKESVVILNFLPMPNTYHKLVEEQEKREELNAQNFAGILNLIRFIGAKKSNPTIIHYSDTVRVHNGPIVDVPFLVDGDTDHARFSDVFPRLGVVPVIADYITTIIRDNKLPAPEIQTDIVNWTQRLVGVVSDPETKFASFGSFSIRYPWQELLRSFSYRFVAELYSEILDPKGADVGKGQTIAVNILNTMMFTQLIVDPAKIPSEPPLPPTFNPAFKVLGSKFRTGKPNDAQFMYPQRDFIRDIVHSAFLRTKEPTNVRSMAEKEMERRREDTKRWLSRQRNAIVVQYVSELEQKLHGIFFDKRESVVLPRTLQDSPCSIVIARDLLDSLREKLQAFKQHLTAQFEKDSYPAGTGSVNVITAHLRTLNDVEKKMRSDRDSQEAYLKEAQRHLDLEIWDLLIQGAVEITGDLINRTDKLWNLVGDDADGWVNLLKKYRSFMEDKLEEDIARRKEFDEFRQRRYTPLTGGGAEDELFMDVAGPVLAKLKSEIYWSFAVKPDEADRYSILINSPPVSGYNDEKQALTDLKDVITGERLKGVKYYNPMRHCYYAKEHLKGSLMSKTIWDILEMECEYDWCTNEKIPAKDRTNDVFIRNLVEEFVKSSGIALNNRLAMRDEKEWTLGYFPDGGARGFATPIINALKEKGLQLRSHVEFSQELRRITCCFRIPIKQWVTYSEAESDYLRYVDTNPPKILIDIYPQEQHASALRKKIETKKDKSFTETLDTSITSALYNKDIFKIFVLSYVLGIIPIKDGAGGFSSPRMFYYQFPNGDVDLAEEWDLYLLTYSINMPERADGDHWRANTDIQDKLKSIWEETEETQQKKGTMTSFLSALEKRGKELQLPDVTGKPDGFGERGRNHMKLAMQAIVRDYVDSLRAILKKKK